MKKSSFWTTNMNKVLLLTSCTKRELNSLRNNGITMALLSEAFLAAVIQWKSEMTSHLNNGYDVMNCFAEFEKLLPHSIIMPSFRNIEGQMPGLNRRRGFLPPPPSYNFGSQNTPYNFKQGNVVEKLQPS